MSAFTRAELLAMLDAYCADPANASDVRVGQGFLAGLRDLIPTLEAERGDYANHADRVAWEAVARNTAQAMLGAVDKLNRLGRRHADDEAHRWAEELENTFTRQCQAHGVQP